MSWYKIRWAIYAPFYNAIVAKFSANARKLSIDGLALKPEEQVLIMGCGTGLDFQHLAKNQKGIAFDYSPTMVSYSKKAASNHPNLMIQTADATQLPLNDACFDAVVLHLIVAVANRPQALVKEAYRVLKPKGRVCVFDKGLIGNSKPTFIRRLLNFLAKPLATAIDLNLEQLAIQANFKVLKRQSILGGTFPYLVIGEGVAHFSLSLIKPIRFFFI